MRSNCFHASLALFALLWFGWSAAGCSRAAFSSSEYNEVTIESQNPALPEPRTEHFGTCAHFVETRQPFFGDLHVHTAYSLDANLRGTRLRPRDAYRFAKGGAVRIPPLNKDGQPTRKVQLGRPLDFAAVTDHAEFLAVIELCQDPNAPSAGRTGCVSFREDPDHAYFMLDRHLSERGPHKLEVREPRLCGMYGRRCRAAQKEVWADLQRAAEEAYDRDNCKFTSFVAYEWTGSPREVLYRKVRNHHRNVIFRTNSVPTTPIDYFHSPSPEELWRELDKHCTSAPIACDVLTIPHNSNLSAGSMFPAPKTRVDALGRAAMEPLVEIYQHKGASECVRGSPAPDEACDFENVPFDDLKGAQFSEFSPPDAQGFVRHAFEQGMRSYDRFGVNAFQYGVIASTDNHLGLPGNVRPDKFVGGGGAGQEGTPSNQFYDKLYFGTGGLAAVWAEENSREALYRALARKETYGTSGPRMRVRLFGGWSLPQDWCGKTERAAIGYENGVPMGGTLTPPVSKRRRPRFAIRAVKDPGTPDYPSSKLQRVQIVKGWIDATGKYQVRVEDVAGSEAVGNDVSARTCKPSDEGFDELCTVWDDRDFDMTEPAYYYVRVLETPSCRWTTHQCNASNYNCDDPTRKIDHQCCQPRAGLVGVEECANVQCPKDNNESKSKKHEKCCQGPMIQPLVQQRAWSSPIWYEPPRTARTPRAPKPTERAAPDPALP